MRTQLALLIAVGCFAAAACRPATGNDRKDLQNLDVERARQFWKTLATGNTAAVKDFYAPQVVLKAGSELLKPQWKLKGANRLRDLQLSREELLQGYQRMIEAIGKEKWSRVMGQIKDDQIKPSIAAKDDAPFAGIKRGDIVLRVAPENSEFYFVFRKDGAGKLLVHLESTDY